MASFCGNCGTHNEDGAFCFHCGQPLDVDAAASEPAEQTMVVAPPPDVTAPPPPPAPSAPQPAAPPQMPAQPMPSQGIPAQPTWSQQPPARYPAAPPARPRVNPFVGWPLSDYLRDAGAAFCLFACLGMWWVLGIDHNGGEQWWVVIAVLLSVVSLATPYLAKAGVVPAWTPLHWRLVKAAANLPMLASVLAAVVNELVHVGDDSEGGIGAGVAMALCGALLALQPREADDPMRREDRAWSVAASFTAVSAAVLVLLMFAGFVIDTDDVLDEPLAFFALLVVAVLMPGVVMAWPMATFLAGSASGRRVFGVATFTLLGTALLAHAEDGTALFYWPQVEKWYGGSLTFGGVGFGGIGIGGTLLIGAAAALSVVGALGRRPSEQTEPVGEWLRTASTALMTTVAGSIVALIGLFLGILDDSDDLASPIVVAVLVLAVGGTAAVASGLLADARKNRLAILGLVAGSVVLGLVAMGVVNGNDLGIENLGGGPSIPITGWVVAVWVCLPLLAAYAVTVPAPVRTALGPLVPQQPTYPAGPPAPPTGFSQPAPPAQYPSQLPPPTPGAPPPPYPPQ